MRLLLAAASVLATLVACHPPELSSLPEASSPPPVPLAPPHRTPQFALQPPQGWTRQTLPGVPHPVFCSDTSRLGIVLETNTDPLADYVAVQQQAFVNAGWHVTATVPFTTLTGIPGTRLSLQGTLFQAPLTVHLFLLNLPDQKAVLTCSGTDPNLLRPCQASALTFAQP
ncbi:MAG: hypothetical protein ACUVSQ_09715 [Pseudanabaenaceae cyanobacterium]